MTLLFKKQIVLCIRTTTIYIKIIAKCKKQSGLSKLHNAIVLCIIRKLLYFIETGFMTSAILFSISTFVLPHFRRRIL